MLQLIQYQKSGEITVEELPDLKCGPGGVLVQNYYSLISAGTERTSVETAQASMLGKAKSRPDLVKQVIDNMKKEGVLATYEKVMNRLDNYKELGYASAGVVIESSVDDYKPGDLVACAGSAFHSELVFIPKHLVARIPSNVAVEQAAFTTLGAIALQGVRQAEVQLGDKVAVIGLGLLGIITVQLLRAAGCAVIGIDINDRNFDLARKSGCDEVAILDDSVEKTVESFTGGYGTDAVIITASTKSNEPLEKSILFARKKSKIVFVGVAGMNLPRNGFYEKELEITISCSYGPGRYDTDYELKGHDYPIGYVRWTEQRNMEAILQMLSSGKINFAPLITHRIPVEKGLDAYDFITGKVKEPYIGILIEYPKEPKKNFVYASKTVKSNAKNDSPMAVGFIGAGNFAQSYLIPPLKKEGIRLVQVATRKPINAKSVAEKFGFESFASDPAEVIANPELNTVFIATHHSSHAKYVVQALEVGKNVFVEKPLAITEEELDIVKNAYQKSGKALMVGFNRRFSPQFKKIKEFFSFSREPFVVNYRVNAGFIPATSWIQDPSQGGRIIGEGCHFIDVFDFLTESKPVSVFASSIRSSNSNVKDSDTVVATITYENGSVANLLYLANGDKAMPKEYCEVYSSGATAVMTDFKEVALYKNGKKSVTKYDGKKGHSEEVTSFLSSIKSVSSCIGFDSLYSTSRIPFLILNSIRAGQRIEF